MRGFHATPPGDARPSTEPQGSLTDGSPRARFVVVGRACETLFCSQSLPSEDPYPVARRRPSSSNGEQPRARSHRGPRSGRRGGEQNEGQDQPQGWRRRDDHRPGQVGDRAPLTGPRQPAAPPRVASPGAVSLSAGGGPQLPPPRRGALRPYCLWYDDCKGWLQSLVGRLAIVRSSSPSPQFN